MTALQDKAKSRKYCLTPKVKAYLRVFPSIIRAKSFSFRRASPRVVQWRLRVSLVPCNMKQMPSTFTPSVLLRCLKDGWRLQLATLNAFYASNRFHTLTLVSFSQQPLRGTGQALSEKLHGSDISVASRAGTRLQVTYSLAGLVDLAHYPDHTITRLKK